MHKDSIVFKQERNKQTVATKMETHRVPQTSWYALAFHLIGTGRGSTQSRQDCPITVDHVACVSVKVDPKLMDLSFD